MGVMTAILENSRDSEVRAAAISIYEELRTRLLSVKTAREVAQLFQATDTERKLRLLKDPVDDVHFDFAPESEMGKAHASYVSDGYGIKLIKVNLRDSDQVREQGTSSLDYNRWFVNYVRRLITAPVVRAAIIHEIIHSFDEEKVDATYWDRQASGMLDTLRSDVSSLDDRMANYINDPLEYNAHFHQLADLIVSHVNALTKRDPGEAELWLGDTASEFIDHVIGTFPNFPLVKYAEGKYMRKLEKRLAQFWNAELVNT